MRIRALKEKDYDKLCQWWKFWRFGAPDRKYLPNNGKGGIMVTNNGIDICCGFLYFTNSKIAWLEFIVSNPEYRENDRQEAIEYLIENLIAIASSKGFEAVFTSVKHPNLINTFKKVGFSVGSNNTMEMTYLV